NAGRPVHGNRGGGGAGDRRAGRSPALAACGAPLMKLWAILKDSFREALDTTVFYVMIGTSAVLALLVGSVGFTPQPAAEIPELYPRLPLTPPPAELAKIPVGLPMGPKALTSLYTLVKVETQDRAPDRPDSPLRFTIKAQYVSRDEAAKVRADPTPAREF